MWTMPTPRTTGELITASIWNTDLRDNLVLLKTSIADDGRLSGEIQKFREALFIDIYVTGSPTESRLTLDLTQANAFAVTLIRDITAIFTSGWIVNKAMTATLRMTQDAVGNHAVNLVIANCRWAGGGGPGAAPPNSLGANRTDLVVLYSDDGGTNIYASMYTQNA